MKQPNYANLKINKAGTDLIKKRAAQVRSVKITINIDQESLTKLKKMSDSTGTPYQRLLNRILKASLGSEATLESRVEYLEREIRKLKKGRESA